MLMLMRACLRAAVAGLGACVLVRARGADGALCVRVRARDCRGHGACDAPGGLPHWYERRCCGVFFTKKKPNKKQILGDKNFCMCKYIFIVVPFRVGSKFKKCVMVHCDGTRLSVDSGL